ncbi:MAG TPA: hypothetical protein VMU14_06390, partial [Acidimicrobiales bacterium]|nr:hypothetical protein [Acidimicrobiales bacterium]
SNLTNLLVLANEHVSGAVFAARMLPAWAVSVVATTAFVAFAFRADLRAGTGLAGSVDRLGLPGPVDRLGPPGPVDRLGPPGPVDPLVPPGPVDRLVDVDHAGRTQVAPRVRGYTAVSAAAVAAAVVLMLALRSPAPAVAAVGLAVALLAIGRGALAPREAWDAVEPLSLAGVFGVAVALGALARAWGAPAHVMSHAGGPATAAIGTIAAVAVNNLPAAVLLGSRHPAHPRALLLGLNLGPNLAVTGSLSALIWWRAAATVGARPSAARVTRLGIALVPLSIALSLVALWLVPGGRV